MASAPLDVRKARIAAAGLFLANGALFANLVPRYPEIKAELALSNTFFGAAVAALSAGALLAGLAAAPVIRKWGSASVAVSSSVVLAVLVVAAGCAPSGILLAAALFCAGAADAITDVAQNAQGLQVQREYHRSILNSLHATWSAGAVLGGLIGAAAIAVGLNRAIQLIATSVVLATVCVAGRRFLLAAPQDSPSEANQSAGGRQPYLLGLALAAFVGLSVAGALIEDAGMSWSTLYLRDVLAAPAAIAPFGFIAVVGCQFVGRTLGDRLVDRFGQRIVVAAGGVIAATGMGAALAYPSVPMTIIGFGAAGLGCAAMVPAAMHAADELPGLRAGTGLTIIAWLMRVGFLVSPLAVGTIADAYGLRFGLLTVPLAGIAAVLLARSLSARNPSAR